MAQAPPPQVARSATRAADSVYTAFENRFRGSREEVRRDRHKALNENVERLNALLFAPVDYALVARR